MEFPSAGEQDRIWAYVFGSSMIFDRRVSEIRRRFGMR
jgi:hypothetical protein